MTHREAESRKRVGIPPENVAKTSSLGHKVAVRLRGRGDVRLTTDEIMDLTRRDWLPESIEGAD